jgi:hypothetical protein
MVSGVQALAGSSFSVFRFPAQPLPHLDEAVETTFLRRYLSRTSGYLVLDQKHVVPLQHEHDSHLMDAVLNAGFSNGDIQLINYCRLYLQVHIVSDITDSTGSHIKTGARSGTFFSCSSTRYIPTIQAHPNVRAWRAWRSALALWATKEDRLTVPLGT